MHRRPPTAATALVKAASALVTLLIGRRPATELTPSCSQEQAVSGI
jgi:hypothetical protein